MIKYILAVIGLFLTVSNPFLILVAGAIGLTWLYCSKKEAAKPKEEPIITPPPKEDKGFTTTEERLEQSKAEISQKMNKDSESDPEIKAKQAELRKEVARNREKAEREMKLDMLREAEKAAEEGDWNKVDQIEREMDELRFYADAPQSTSILKKG